VRLCAQLRQPTLQHYRTDRACRVDQCFDCGGPDLFSRRWVAHTTKHERNNRMSDPTNDEIIAATKSIANLRRWIIEVYEDTGKYEELAFQALNSTVQTAGWKNFAINTIINLATGIIDGVAILSEVPIVVPAVGFLSAEIKVWLNAGSRPAKLQDVYIDYALSHLAMQEAMEQQLAHYLDETGNHANLRASWNKTFQVQGTTYQVSDLAKKEHAFPDVGDTWSTTKAIATAEFQKRLWNLIVMKTCKYYLNYS